MRHLIVRLLARLLRPVLAEIERQRTEEMMADERRKRADPEYAKACHERQKALVERLGWWPPVNLPPIRPRQSSQAGSE
jgi:hypothetical protein